MSGPGTLEHLLAKLYQPTIGHRPASNQCRLIASVLRKQRVDQFTGSLKVDFYADGVVEERSDAFDSLIAPEFASLPSCTVDECFPLVLAQHRERVGVPEDVELGVGVNLFCDIYRSLFPAHLLIT